MNWVRTRSLMLSRALEAELSNHTATKTLLNRNNGKYRDKRWNDATTDQKNMNELQKLDYRWYMYSSSSMIYKTNFSRYFILLFLAGVEMKNKLLLEKIEITRLF